MKAKSSTTKTARRKFVIGQVIRLTANKHDLDSVDILYREAAQIGTIKKLLPQEEGKQYAPKYQNDLWYEVETKITASDSFPEGWQVPESLMEAA